MSSYLGKNSMYWVCWPGILSAFPATQTMDVLSQAGVIMEHVVCVLSMPLLTHQLD